MSRLKCLANGGANHHWKYRDDPMRGRVRECQGCGALEQRQPNGRYKLATSTRWVPETPAERARSFTEAELHAAVEPHVDNHGHELHQ